jgi:hypothetical protein
MATLAARRPQALGTRLFLWVSGGLALVIGMLTVAQSLRVPFVSFDTTVLIQAVDSALTHLRKGQVQNWGGNYPLLQAIPIFALRAAGVSSSNVILALVALNVLSVAALTLISWRSLLRQSRPGAILVVAVLLSGPLLWYAHSSFGEPLAATVTLAAVIASWHHRRHLAAAWFLFLAGLSKDFAVPFLLLLTIAASVGSAHWTERSFRLPRVTALLIAGAVSLLVTSAYNYARFGSLLDVPYLASHLYVPWLTTQLSFFAAVWLAPNGGILPFWPSFGVLLMLAMVGVGRAWRAEPEWRESLRSLAPAAAVAATLLGTTWVLSKWMAPLGWVAWGPRLSLPWLPASAFLLVAAYSGEFERLLARLSRPFWGFGIATVVLAIASLPQYVALVRPNLWHIVFETDWDCPVIAIIENGAPYYYHCTNHMLWTKGSMLVTAYSPGADPVPFLLACGCAAGLVWLIYRLRSASLAA